ncbi:acetyltransferase [Allopontixanthobacter sp.]|uniref:acetyltransferase n=1 Tax=Allopontixanthobacter sp. TaxID=2906452 RepID=UPI002AB9BF06|nr:acetyltransferase [Allopontixanthobacter sp.]MDZ4307439.1 acetyltransferase [Allopontixanthobacter sp.]
MTQPLYAIYGAGGAGRGIMPLLRAMYPAAECVFVDDGFSADHCNGHAVMTLGEFRERDAGDKGIALAVADGALRKALAFKCAEAGIRFLTVRGAPIVEMDDVVVGEGAIISPFVTFTSNIRIGAHFHANIYSYVEHDCAIGDFVTFAPSVCCNGNVEVGDGAYIGAGALIRQGTPGRKLQIGKGAVIGMGAVVLGDVPDGATYVGNPARPITPRSS